MDRRRLLNKNNLILGGVITLIVTLLAWALTTYTSWATIGIRLSYKHEEKDFPGIYIRVNSIEERNKQCDSQWVDVKRDMKIQTAILKAWAKKEDLQVPAETFLGTD